jgi:Lon protease-like protein
MRFHTETDLVQFALEGASFDPDMAEDVLQFFCDVVNHGGVPERNVLEYLTGCFGRIINGEQPSDALNLTRAKGQRRLRTLNKIAEGHLLLALRVVRCMKAGAKRDDAIVLVASERFGDHDKVASTATVKRAYERYRQRAKDLTK